MDFSVVIPLHNRIQFIQRTLDSVYSQTLLPREVVVVDDGSSDGSPSLVQDEYPQAMLIRQANLGPGPARNSGIEASNSSWIAFLDSDDVWRPNHLEELARVIQSCPEIGLACTRYEVAGNLVPDRLEPNPQGETRLIGYFLEDAPAFTSATAINREAFERIGGFLSRVPGQDKEFWARIALHYRVGMSTTATAVYRTGTGGISESVSLERDSIPLAIEDVSLALATVAEALKSETPTLPTIDSLRAFLNYRLEHRLKQELIYGDVEYARALRPFFVSPIAPRRRLLVEATRAPTPALLAGVRAFRSIKRLLERL